MQSKTPLLLLLTTISLYGIDFNSSKDQLKKQLLQYDKKHNISSFKKWLDISGWKKGVFGWSANNQDLRAFASKEALNSPQEDFIGFALEYINPPITTVENSIKCRTPKKYDFVKELFKDKFLSPLEQEDIICSTIEKGFLDDLLFLDELSAKPIDMGDINSSTVTGFELLYATPGTADASEIAGHLLLRIKLDNNPTAKKLGIENPNDIVVSFLANTQPDKTTQEVKKPILKEECTKNWFNIVENNNEFNALESIWQSIKGLYGGFLTIMDRQTLAQAVKHYTIEEDRNLLRFELILTPKQKEDLLDRLFRAKKNYNARYYFFTQNCASVLIKVVGEGIEDKHISQFDPITSAPNSLITLFTRKGLAKPVYPSFHSYRKKGYLAQDSIKNYYEDLESKYPKLKFPNIKPLFNSSIEKRIDFINKIKKFYNKNQNLHNELWELSNLIQSAEMVYEYKDMYCKRYTSKVTSNIREFQTTLLDKEIDISKDSYIEDKIVKEFEQKEQNIYNNGLHHTQLNPLAIGFGQYEDKTITHLELSVIKQNMGSFSNIAMQRGNSVDLGNIYANITKDSDITTWGITALQIQKIKERLDLIPSYFTQNGKLGLGLRALDYKGDKTNDSYYGTIFGGELLFNIISSQNNDNYAFFSLGANISHQKYNNQTNKGITIPTYLQTQLTFGQKYQLQWENRLLYNNSTTKDIDDKIDFTSQLRYKLPKIDNKLPLLKLSFNYQYFPEHKLSTKDIWLGIELNRW